MADPPHPLITLRRQLFAPVSEAEQARLCQACSASLPLFVSDELAGHDVDRRYPETAAHMDNCPTCLAEYETLTAWMWAVFIDPETE